MPNNKSSSSSSSSNQGNQSHRSTYSLAKEAGFDSPYHAGLSYGIKIYEDGANTEIRTILEAITSAGDGGNSGSNHGSAKK
ncbi:hypothetical protein GQX73_g10054 [Xylaria multiplex]|uniref:Uncharacterized protein n=1 Tax=Xylaria multiplex TaxID=323545 RepID=A0A7C8MM50_9PEZI|nr:hypothetical protein GQX73_g10054 [Xylaria multiplex]